MDNQQETLVKLLKGSSETTHGTPISPIFKLIINKKGYMFKALSFQFDF